MSLKEAPIEDIDRTIEFYYKSYLKVLSLLSIITHDELSKTDNSIIKETQDQLKFNCFIISSLLDLLTVVKGYKMSKHDWEGTYYTKTAYHIIYETIKTYRQSYNKGTSILINEKLPHLIPERTKIKKYLNEFLNSLEIDIESMRNATTGHYDADFLVYHSHLSKINPDKCLDVIEKFAKFITLLIGLTYKIADDLMPDEKMDDETRAMAEFIVKAINANIK